MSIEKLKNLVRQPLLASSILVVLLLVGVSSITPLRAGMISWMDRGTQYLLAEGIEDEEVAANPDQGGEAKKKGNPFKKIVTAPVRLFVGIFRHRDDSMAVRQAKEGEIDRMKMIALQRTRSSQDIQDMMADLGQPVDTEATVSHTAAQNLFEEAIGLQEKGRIDSALEKLTAATVLESNFAEAYNLLGVCYDQKKQYQLAQEEYSKAIQIDRNNGRYMNNLGYSFYLAGDDGAAIKWYRKGLKSSPHDRRLHNNLGLAYGRKGNMQKAREHFIISVGETGAQLNLGYIFSQQGKYEEAIRQYQMALASQPQSLPALSNLAQLYERTGHLREAAQLGEQYRKVLAINQQKDQTVDQ